MESHNITGIVEVAVIIFSFESVHSQNTIPIYTPFIVHQYYDKVFKYHKMELTEIAVIAPVSTYPPYVEIKTFILF